MCRNSKDVDNNTSIHSIEHGIAPITLITSVVPPNMPCTQFDTPDLPNITIVIPILVGQPLQTQIVLNFFKLAFFVH